MIKSGFYYDETTNTLFLIYPNGKVEIYSALDRWKYSDRPHIWRDLGYNDFLVEVYE